MPPSWHHVMHGLARREASPPSSLTPCACTGMRCGSTPGNVLEWPLITHARRRQEDYGAPERVAQGDRVYFDQQQLGYGIQQRHQQQHQQQLAQHQQNLVGITTRCECNRRQTCPPTSISCGCTHLSVLSLHPCCSDRLAHASPPTLTSSPPFSSSSPSLHHYTWR